MQLILLTARGRAAAVAVATLVFGCVDGFEPPPGTYSFQPPLAYEGAWEWVEDCSGLQGDMSRVQWYAVPADVFDCDEGRRCRGAWNAPHNIFVSEWARDDSVSFYTTVRHEMLHDLLGGGGPGGEAHPPVFVICGLMGT